MAAALVRQEWVEEKAREWGEDNPVYRSKVLGEFSEDSPNQVVRGSDIATCRTPKEQKTPADKLLPVGLGVDGGGGGDEAGVREGGGVRAGRGGRWPRGGDA